MEPLRIDIVSDVVCPWCYIGKRRLEAALASPEAAGLPPVQITWHPFQLNPDLPAEGIDRKAYLEEKFGGPERAAAIYERVRAAGRTAGLELNIDGIARQPNTRLAHALIDFAQRSGGDATDVKERLLRAYFIENRFVGDAEVLAAIAAEAGLDAAAARAHLDDPEALAAIDEADQQARQMGVSGVPFFIFNRKLAVSGAQEPATLVGAMRQAVEQA
ncbi:MAG: DsbA family oxidoreductase [Pseudorhodoferax sp.]